MPQNPNPDPDNLDLAKFLGAEANYSMDRLTIYIPDRDQDGAEFGTQRRYVLEAAQLLARMGGGVTIVPPVEGGWLNPQTNAIIWEHPVMVYTFVNPDAFVQLLPELRSFMHRLGRETQQGEVAIEFAGVFYRLRQYEEK